MTYDFSGVYSSLQSYIDRDLLSGVSVVLLANNEIVDSKTLGYADTGSKKKISEDTIFRIYSNTKIITSVAAMCCYEKGCFELDDPLDKYIPKFSRLAVLKKESQTATGTEALASRPSVRQLMCHNAGFSYGFLMESPVDELYNKARILDPQTTLSEMVDKLADLPLASQPGTRFQYSLSTDVLARLVEIWSGQPFGEFLKERIFKPLQMIDTGFYLPADKHDRLATQYLPLNPLDPMEPGLTVGDDQAMGSYFEPKPMESGGGGLVSTIGEYTRFLRMLIAEGEFEGARILKPETVKLMHTNQLPAGITFQSNTWPMPNTVFGLGLAIKTAPGEGEPEEAIDEFHWGGIAGTHTWISLRAGIAALVFTQRFPGFCHPFSYDFKREVYSAMSSKASSS